MSLAVIPSFLLGSFIFLWVNIKIQTPWCTLLNNFIIKNKRVSFSGNFGVMTNMIVANVLYFKGEWEKPFSKHSTALKEFHSVKGSQQVSIMTWNEYFQFGVLP